MLVTELLKLAPSPEQGEALLATMRACNAAADRAAEVAFEHKTANKIRLQKLCYQDLRAEFGLTAQMAIRSISKACEAYKRDKKIQPSFRPLGAIAYDQRILSWKGRDQGVPSDLERPDRRPRDLARALDVRHRDHDACRCRSDLSGQRVLPRSRN